MPTKEELIAILHSSDNNEWYTPKPYVEAARQALGGAIAFDPASSRAANETVKAGRYYSLERDEDGLSLRWFDHWFCNPPYGWRRWKGKKRSNQELWVSKAIEEYATEGRRGIMLINANTEAKYLNYVWRSYWKFFTDHRIRFDLPPGAMPKNQPTKGNLFILFGENWAKFGRAFQQVGGYLVPPIPSYDYAARYVGLAARALDRPPF